eukprot:5039704-Pleurochrysis_carterae.AAC.1
MSQVRPSTSCNKPYSPYVLRQHLSPRGMPTTRALRTAKATEKHYFSNAKARSLKLERFLARFIHACLFVETSSVPILRLKSLRPYYLPRTRRVR